MATIPAWSLAWNAIAVSATTGNPFTQARFMAISVQLAMLAAVDADHGQRSEPYLGTVLEHRRVG